MHVAVGQNQFSDGGPTLVSELELAGIETHQLTSLGRDISLGADIRALMQLTSLMRELRPDVVHLNSSKMSVMGGIASTLSRTPRSVFTAHGFPFFEDRSKSAQVGLEVLTRLGVVLLDDLITLSAKESDYALKWREARSKVHLVPNGISATNVYERVESRRILSEALGPASSRLDDDLILIGSIAELHPNKNIETTLRALGKLTKSRPAARFKYFHFGTGELEQELESLREELGLQEVAHFLGFRSDARRLLSAFDIFVLPSKKEGLPYSLLEAALARNAIVSSAVGGIPSVLRNDAGLLLEDPTNVDELHDHLSALLTDDELRNGLGLAAENRVAEVFTVEKMIQATEAIYSGSPLGPSTS